MKKSMLILVAVVIGIIVITENNTTEEIVIPNDSIRIRVIAPSDSIEDQKLKGNVKRSIQGQLSEMLKDVKTIDQAREVLNKNLSDVEYTVKTELKRNNSNINFNVNYGLNYFPIKEYKGITYDDGYYESLVITLGQGQGKNWWCVLFPPLCLMDEEEENMENVEYKSFIKEILFFCLNWCFQSFNLCYRILDSTMLICVIINPSGNLSILFFDRLKELCKHKNILPFFIAFIL